jgi:proteasome lid subunit RPN8/RPN11
MKTPSTKLQKRRLKLRRLLRRPRENRIRPRSRTRLGFSPTAWAKLLYLRDRGPTEVGAFGIAPDADLLYVEDIQLVQQACSVVSVAFDDTAVAEFFDDQVDAGLRPEQFARIWIHTHPGESPEPSYLDERTLSRVFGTCDWAVMFILARGGETYCRLQFSAGPGGSFEIPVDVDFEHAFAESQFAAWGNEYAAAVRPIELTPSFDGSKANTLSIEGLSLTDEDFLEELNGISLAKKGLPSP